MKTILTAMFNFLLAMNPFLTSAGVLLVTLLGGFRWLNAQYTTLISRLDALIMPSGVSGASIDLQPLGFINTFVPLSEAIAFFTAWVALLLICVGIRIVKSFVPTVAS